MSREKFPSIPRLPATYGQVCVLYTILRPGCTETIHATVVSGIYPVDQILAEARKAIVANHTWAAPLQPGDYQILGWVYADSRIQVEVINQNEG